jgi:hypothetical protein
MARSGRDWLNKEQRDRLDRGDHFRRTSEPKSWLMIIFTWVGVLYLLFKASQYFLGPSFKSPTAPLPTLRPPTPVVEVAPRIVEQPQTVSRPPVVIRQAQQPPEPRNSPANQKGVTTIYRCKAYAGGIFWSNAYCGTQQALVDRIATVPGSLTFDQQVQVAEGQRVEAMSLYQQRPSASTQAADRCSALKRERDVIESRYTNWQWQPPEVINPDQTRMRGLRAEQARLGCPTQ